MTDILAIVGSTEFVNPLAMGIASYIISAELNKRMPDKVVSGGAMGIDSLAVEIARGYGIECEEFLPAERNWERGFKPRNLKIAHACTRAIRISCHASTTYGSGWTCDRIKEMGKYVTSYVL